MDALQAVALELARAQAGRLGLGRGGRAGVVSLGHERADDVRLAALVQQPAHAREHLVAPVQAEHAGDDRRSPRRQLVEHRHLQVAVDRERQRPRDRGRGHVQHVRRRPLAGLLLERLPLLDAEPVLLVDDGHAQLPVVDARLDQGVRPDRNGGLAGAEEPLRRPPLARRHPLHEPDHAHPERLAQGREPDQVLGRERLGRAPSAPPGRRPRPPRTSAYAATAVLPEPTSPCSRRRIGTARPRSASISPTARLWAPVSSNGSALTNEAERAPGAGSGRALASASNLARRRRRPSWSRCSSS